MIILRIVACAMLTALMLSYSGSVFAQSAADLDRAARQSEQIQREQLLRQRDDIERSLEENRPSTRLEMPLPETPKGAGEGCQDIWKIRITGGLHMPDARKEEIVKPFAGTCVGVAEIQTMLSQITAYYIEAGFATTRVYLPGQDLSTGTLHIDIIEGRVGSLQRQEGDEGSIFLGGALPGIKGEILNLRDFEQGLDQLNRLQSNNASLDIAPGAAVGESAITIRNTPTRRWHASLTGDNYGTVSTGRRQVAATASYDNLLGINDFLSVTERKTIPLNDERQQSTATSMLMSVPYGYTTFTGGYSYSYYDSTLVTAGGAELHLNGDNRSVFAGVDHVVYRDQVNKVTVSATLTDKKARNYIAGQKLAVSSRELAVADIGVALSTTVLGGSGNVSLGYSRGLKLLGALQDTPGQSDDLPTAQFNKLTAGASWFRPFQLDDLAFTWSSQLAAQTARDTLYGSEQISIGGIYTVRGFHEETLANDDGYYLRNDLTLREILGTAWGQSILFNPYVALDTGAVTGKAPGSPHGTLVGGAAGFSLAIGPADFDLFTGHPIKAPDDLGNEGFTTFGRLSVSF